MSIDILVYSSLIIELEQHFNKVQSTLTLLFFLLFFHLIKQLSLRQGKQPIQQASYWQKPKRIVITLLDQQKKSKPDAIEWLREVAGGAEIIVTDSRKPGSDHSFL